MKYFSELIFLLKCYLRSHQIHIVYGIPAEDRPRIAAEIMLTLSLVVFQQNMLAQDVPRAPQIAHQDKDFDRHEDRLSARKNHDGDQDDDDDLAVDKSGASKGQRGQNGKSARQAASLLVNLPVVNSASVNSCYPQAWNAMGGASVMAASVLCSKVRQPSDIAAVISCYSSAWQVNGGNILAAATLCSAAIN